MAMAARLTVLDIQLPKLNVEGSNPFGRSTRGTGLRDVDALDGLRDVARSPGYVAKLDSVTVVGDGYEVIRRFP